MSDTRTEVVITIVSAIDPDGVQMTYHVDRRCDCPACSRALAMSLATLLLTTCEETRLRPEHLLRLARRVDYDISEVQEIDMIDPVAGHA